MVKDMILKSGLIFFNGISGYIRRDIGKFELRRVLVSDKLKGVINATYQAC